MICSLVLVMSVESPVLSIDCKKKERLGNLYRDGKCYCTKAVKVYDHDYEHLSKGKVIPQAFMIYRPIKVMFPLATAAKRPVL